MKYAPYSASRLATFEQCNRKFQYKYIDKIQVPFEPSVALTRGGIIHSLLENHGKMTLKESVQQLKEDPQIAKSPFYTKEVVRDCLKVFKSFIETDIAKEIFDELELGTELHLGLDGKLNPCEYLSKDVLFRGMIDRVTVNRTTNVVRIIDWKTGKDKSTGTYKQAPDQLMHYASWYFTKFPVDTLIITYVFVEHNTTLEYTLTRDKLNAYNKALLTPIVKAEKADEFPKDLSPLCNFCEFYTHCNNDIEA